MGYTRAQERLGSRPTPAAAATHPAKLALARRGGELSPPLLAVRVQRAAVGVLVVLLRTAGREGARRAARWSGAAHAVAARPELRQRTLGSRHECAVGHGRAVAHLQLVQLRNRLALERVDGSGGLGPRLLRVGTPLLCNLGLLRGGG